MKKTIQLIAILIIMICGNSMLNAQCSIYTSPNQTFCCGPAVVQLSASISSTYCNCTNYSYAWSPTVGLSNPYIANPTATVNANTNYVVCITAYRKAPCTAVCCTVCQTVSINVNSSCCRTTGLQSTASDIAVINVYPNPGATNLNIDINAEVNSANITLYDVNGKVSWQKQNISGKSKLSIDVSTMPRGIYFISASEGNKEIYNSKIIIE